MIEEGFYSEAEAAEYLGMTPGELGWLRQTGKIRFTQRERGRPRILYFRAHLDAYRRARG